MEGAPNMHEKLSQKNDCNKHRKIQDDVFKQPKHETEIKR